MPNRARTLREAVVRALARVGLVWSLAVLGALFMAMSAQGLHHDGGYSLASSDQPAFSVTSGHAPRTAGLALALIVLSSGITVLAVGAARGDRQPDRRPGRDRAPEPQPTPDLSLALGLGLLP